MPMSLDDIRQAVRNALAAQYPSGNGNAKYWIRELFLDHAIVEDNFGAQLFRVGYTLGADDTAALADDLTPVEITYTPIQEAVRILESKDPEGREWEVVLIEAGTSKNRNHYPAEVLREAVPLFEGARAMAHAGGEHVEPGQKSVRDIVGWYDQVRESGGKLLARFHILESADWLRKMLLDGWSRGKKDLVGFSIDADGRTTLKRLAEGVVRWIEKIVRVDSVDVVLEPAAGGKLTRLVASNHTQDKEEVAMLEKLLKLLESKRPDLYKTIDPAKITEGEVLKLLEAAVPEASGRNADLAAAETGKSTERFTEAENRLRLTECRIALREALSGSNLPELAQARLRKRFTDRIFEEAELTEAIKDEREYLAQLTESGRPVGMGTVQVTESERDRLIKALDGFFTGKDVDGVPRLQSFKEAHARFTGRWGLHPSEILMESYPGRRAEGGLLRESLTSSSWAEVLGDAITRRLIAVYNLPGLSDWRRIVSSIVPISDFRTQNRTRTGGYGVLPTVNEGANYAALTSPTDEQVQYSLLNQKRGGTEDLTIEMVANDDVGAIRRIPDSLARAAGQTLHRFVFDFIRTNPNFDPDVTAIFAAGHGNLGSAALSNSSLMAARVAMRKQTAYGNTSEVLGNPGRFLLHPPDLEELAFQLASSERQIGTADNQRNMFAGRIEPITVDYWTDPNDWALIADPANVPTIEVGFFEGREEPELFVQDMPNVGSMFTADKVTYKIRHIYSGDVLDYRGMYKAVVA